MKWIGFENAILTFGVNTTGFIVIGVNVVGFIAIGVNTGGVFAFGVNTGGGAFSVGLNTISPFAIGMNAGSGAGCGGIMSNPSITGTARVTALIACIALAVANTVVAVMLLQNSSKETDPTKFFILRFTGASFIGCAVLCLGVLALTMTTPQWPVRLVEMVG